MSLPFLPTLDHPGRILVVDDQRDNLRVLSLELKRQPFALTCVETAAEALAFCGKEVFEGILLDVSLPEMDGIEVCRRLRQKGLNTRTPVIFLSAMRVGEGWVTQGLEAGGMDYLTKPYSFPELLAKLRVMVRLSRQNEALMAHERQQALIEVAGGAAHALAQPLAAAQILADQLAKQNPPASHEQLEQLGAFLQQTAQILRQIQNLHTYVTKPYASGHILDLAQSSRPEAVQDASWS
ncbi:MAG: response regulator [Acidobacteria bacterium]|nr:response regulator [Acidobacteriota bacterium]MBI3486674.1 response regulator [Acidobacteriota bacterium]